MEKQSNMSLFEELKLLRQNIKGIEFKPAFVLVSVAVIEVISYYYCGTRAFRKYFAKLFELGDLARFYRYIYWLSADFVIHFIVPVLLSAFILRQKPRDFGLGWGDYRMGIKIFVLFMIIMMPILWIATSFPGFIQKYPHTSAVLSNWTLFAIYNLCFILYMIGWEFIWRGYMLFGLKEKFGYYAILIQMIPFVILHNGKPVAETLGAIVAGIALGILAWRTNSFWYCAMTHASVMVAINLIATLRFRTDVYGIGITSLFELIKGIF